MTGDAGGPEDTRPEPPPAGAAPERGEPPAGGFPPAAWGPDDGFPETSPPDPEELEPEASPAPPDEGAPLSEAWITIWTEPRRTILRLVRRDPRYMVVPLAIVGGIAGGLGGPARPALSTEPPSIAAVLVGAFLLGPVFGVLALYVIAWLVAVTGRWLGGEAATRELRTALGWSNAPMVLMLPLRLFAIALFGTALYGDATDLARAGGATAPLFVLYGLASAVLAIWALVILLNGVGAVQRFSLWRALANVLLAGAVVAIVVVGGVAVLVGLVAHAAFG